MLGTGMLTAERETVRGSGCTDRVAVQAVLDALLHLAAGHHFLVVVRHGAASGCM